MIIEEMNDRIRRQYTDSEHSFSQIPADAIQTDTTSFNSKSVRHLSFSFNNVVPWIIIVVSWFYIACIHWDQVPNYSEETSTNQQHSVSDLVAQITSCNITKHECTSRFEHCSVDLQEVQRKLDRTESNLIETLDGLQTCKEGEAQNKKLLLELSGKAEDVERLEHKVNREERARKKADQSVHALEATIHDLNVELEEEQNGSFCWMMNFFAFAMGVVLGLSWYGRKGEQRRLNAQIRKLRGTIDTLDSEVKNGNTEKNALDEGIAAQTKHKKKMDGEVLEQEKLLAKLQNTVSELESKKQRFEEQIRDPKAAKEELEKDIVHLDVNKKNLSEETKVLEKEVRSQNENKKQLKKQIIVRKNKKSKLDQEILDRENRKGNVNDEVHVLEKIKEELKGVVVSTLLRK